MWYSTMACWTYGKRLGCETMSRMIFLTEATYLEKAMASQVMRRRRTPRGLTGSGVLRMLGGGS
jgi:hypothetical protein